MDLRLTDRQREAREAARRFSATVVQPWAERIDRLQTTPDVVLAEIAASGYLGMALPNEWGGGGADAVSHGVTLEAIGAVCSSVRSLLTVHNMAAQAIARFGTPEQRAKWLPDLCAGRKIIAFALTEPDVGSAAHAIETTAVERPGGFILTGTKRWVTYGLRADLFLVFAQYEGKAIALLIDRASEGLTSTPTEVFGTRGSMVAELRFDAVEVPADRLLGRIGAGISFVCNTALDHGRFSVAWGSTGIIQACLDASLDYAEKRRQGGQKLRDYQLIRRQLTDLLARHSTARALCYRSAFLRDQGDPRAGMETAMAKYWASMGALDAANAAVLLHGGNGCAPDYPVSRYLRDATVVGVIEGTREIHQISLANYAYQRPYMSD